MQKRCQPLFPVKRAIYGCHVGTRPAKTVQQVKFLFNKDTDDIHQQILVIGKHHDLLLCNEVLDKRLLDCLRSRYMYSC